MWIWIDPFIGVALASIVDCVRGFPRLMAVSEVSRKFWWLIDWSERQILPIWSNFDQIISGSNSTRLPFLVPPNWRSSPDGTTIKDWKEKRDHQKTRNWSLIERVNTAYLAARIRVSVTALMPRFVFSSWTFIVALVIAFASRPKRPSTEAIRS